MHSPTNSELSTANTTACTSTLVLTPKPRTTFLDLPREIRQQILSQSYPFTLIVKPPAETNTSLLRNLTDNRNKKKCDEIKDSLARWHGDLSFVDPIVKDDVDWVYQKWIEGVDQVYAECGGGRRALFIVYWTF